MVGNPPPSGGAGPPIPDGGFGPLPTPGTIWHFPVALGLLAVSIFLLIQSAAFLRWATKDDPDAPDPRAGIRLAWALTTGIAIYFYSQSFTFRLFTNNQNDFPSFFVTFLLGFIVFIFREPEALSQALLFSSLPIGALAAFKFTMAASLVRSAQLTPSALTQSPLSLLIAASFTLLQLAGSVASLIALFL